MKDTVIKLKEEDVEVISSDDLIHKRSTKFTENAFEDPKAMVYEKSNAFALSYYGISKSEQSLLLAGLVAAYNVNKAAPYTEAEKEAGLKDGLLPKIHISGCVKFILVIIYKTKRYVRM